MNVSKIDQVTSLHKNNEVQYLCFRLEKANTRTATQVVLEKCRENPTFLQYCIDNGIVIRNKSDQ